MLNRVNRRVNAINPAALIILPHNTCLPSKDIQELYVALQTQSLFISVLDSSWGRVSFQLNRCSLLYAGCRGDMENESAGEEAACAPGTTGDHAFSSPPSRAQEEHWTDQSAEWVPRLSYCRCCHHATVLDICKLLIYYLFKQNHTTFAEYIEFLMCLRVKAALLKIEW